MLDIKLVLFDVDSTLTAGVNQPVVESAIEACKQLQKKGIKVGIASGRPPYAMPSIDGKIFADYYIGANGQIVTDKDKKTLFTYRFDKRVFSEINEYCQKNEIGLFWKFEDMVCIYQDCELMGFIMKSFNEHRYGLHDNPDETPCGGGLVCSKEQLEAFKKRFGEDIEIVDGGYILYDLGVKGVTKATGIERLIEMLGITKEQCIAFGDSDNDIEMIELAGIGVAMGNGYESVKKVADYVTDTAANDGIEKALKKYGIL